MESRLTWCVSGETPFLAGMLLGTPPSSHATASADNLMGEKHTSDSTDPALATENWERFLPKFKKRNVKRKKPKNKKNRDKIDTPFPPAPMPSKVSGGWWCV